MDNTSQVDIDPLPSNADLETAKLFRVLMDKEQGELETSIRNQLLDFQKKAGRVIYFEPAGNKMIFKLKRIFMCYDEIKAAVLHKASSPEFYR